MISCLWVFFFSLAHRQKHHDSQPCLIVDNMILECVWCVCVSNPLSIGLLALFFSPFPGFAFVRTVIRRTLGDWWRWSCMAVCRWSSPIDCSPLFTRTWAEWTEWAGYFSCWGAAGWGECWEVKGVFLFWKQRYGSVRFLLQNKPWTFDDIRCFFGTLSVLRLRHLQVFYQIGIVPFI